MDDIVLVIDTLQETVRILRELCAASKKYGLKINKKRKVIYRSTTIVANTTEQVNEYI